MGVLTDLVGRLQARLRTVQAECTPDYLEWAIGAAARAYADLRPRLAPLKLTWAPGQADVTLPEDFMAMEPETWAAATEPASQEPSIYDGGGYGRIGGGALRPTMPVPSTASYSFRIYPGNPGKVRIKPTPASQVEIECDYHGAHFVSDVAGETTVPKPDWELIVLRAVYDVWSDIARERAARPVSFEVTGDGNGQRIRMADPDKLADLAARDNAEFLRRLNRPWGVRA